jgi:hypothetical protein
LYLEHILLCIDLIFGVYRCPTVLFGAGMNDTESRIFRLMRELGMHYTVLLAQACLMMFALSNIIYLHAIVTF